ncbi:unnamed protein product [Umbelopsis ramanniana]
MSAFKSENYKACACVFQLSTAAPSAPSDDDYILAYTDSAGAENAIPLPENECINLDMPLKNATYIARGSTPTNLYPAHDCKGAAIALAPRADYNGPTLILSVERP